MKDKIIYILLCAIVLVVGMLVSFKVDSIRAKIYANEINKEINKEYK